MTRTYRENKFILEQQFETLALFLGMLPWTTVTKICFKFETNTNWDGLVLLDFNKELLSIFSTTPRSNLHQRLLKTIQSKSSIGASHHNTSRQTFHQLWRRFQYKIHGSQQSKLKSLPNSTWQCSTMKLELVSHLIASIYINIERIYCMTARRYEIPLRELKKYFISERCERVKRFSTLEELIDLLPLGIPLNFI